MALGSMPVAKGSGDHRSWASKVPKNVRTTDSLREERETVSHTTQLSQMYRLLQAYHVGTNRLMFFISPHVLNRSHQWAAGDVRGSKTITLTRWLTFFRFTCTFPPLAAFIVMSAHGFPALEAAQVTPDL
jgi:hypothetical protein